MSDSDGTIVVQKVFRRPGDDAGQIRVRFVVGEDSVTVKFQATRSPRLVTFLIEHSGDIEVEERTQSE